MLLNLAVLVQNIFLRKSKRLLVIKIPRDLRSQKNVFRIQAYDTVLCGYFCIGFIDFMRKGKSLTDFTNLFSLNNFEKK